MKLRRHDNPVRLELTPLIDVVFLLLTFFIFSLVLMVRADVLDVDLPALTRGRPLEPAATIVIGVDREGRLFLEDQPVEPDDLGPAILRRSQDDPDAKLLVAVDEQADSAALIRAAELLIDAGLGEFAIMGRPAMPTPRPLE